MRGMIRSSAVRRDHGFTLVELLGGIGIIALLISILLPALGKARQSAMSIKCQSNLRQIGQALVFYTNANKGSLPYGYWNGSPAPCTGAMDGKPASGAANDLNKNTTGNESNIRFRHRKNNAANALFVDGHVEQFLMVGQTQSEFLRKHLT